ncbi:hypothetical protein [Fodinicola acaciae]|uniref:hypothetical protein n=1 Tax=Fodinicola acaciae TaxID=2681555 RepID=UPI0016528243|nr:hypothetical protein [Fodinicola acaciae]
MSAGWGFLALAVVFYGFANFLQAIAATSERGSTRVGARMLFRLATHRTYLAGILCQFLGFVFAFFARADLPLFLVQSAAAGGLGLTTLLGVMILKWRLPSVEVVLLGGLAFGLVALVISAGPSPSEPLNVFEVVLLAGTAVGIALLGRPASRLRGSEGAVALGSLSGLGFSAAAIASRPLAGHDTILQFVGDPLLYIVVVNSIIGQVLLAAAMQRGATTAAVASMEAATAVPAAFFGVVLLGDKIRPGLTWLAVLGFVVTLTSVLLMTRFSSEQHGSTPGDYPLQMRQRRRTQISNSRWVAAPRRRNTRRRYRRGRTPRVR